jgi:lactoylglutathione lyase
LLSGIDPTGGSPKVSLDFYCNVLGFNLIMYKEFPQWEFNVYFVAYHPPENIPASAEDRWRFCMTTPGCIELTWNYGSETETGLVYNTGNSDATGSQDGQKVRGGFGHLGITVPGEIPRRRRSLSSRGAAARSAGASL